MMRCVASVVRCCAFAGLLVLASCVTILPRGRTGQRIPVSSKPVASMRQPVYLIAYDLSECTVSKERFKKVRIGDNVICAWSSPR